MRIMKLNRTTLLASALVVLCVLTGVLFLTRVSKTGVLQADCLKHLQNSNPVSSTPCPSILAKNFSNKKFAYLVQTESCLNDYLLSSEVLGDATTCRCDVLVLSFKNRCEHTSLPHVHYMFDPSTTWSTGRNLLYRTIVSQASSYIYYTFLDDDVILRFGDRSDVTANPWREYENSLLDAEPLVAASWHMTENIFHRYYWGFCDYPNTTQFLPHVWFDALFNSFHRTVICHLLPYYTALDHVSWWFSQVHLIIKTDLMFPGQALLHLNVFADNPVHRSYPRGLYRKNTIKQFTENLVKQIPPEYQELLTPTLQDWVNTYHSKEYVFPDYCVDLPLSTATVIPYSYRVCGI